MKKLRINSFATTVSIVVLIYFLIVTVWPFVYSLYLSFFSTDLITKQEFIGFKNYEKVFTNPVFRQIITNNIIYLAVTVFGAIIIALILAYNIHKLSGWVKKLFLGIYFLPTITSLVATAAIWRQLYFPHTGFLAQLWNFILPIEAPVFLRDQKTALFSIMVMFVWRVVGMKMIILHTALDEIPDSIIDSAKIDGAYGWQYITKIMIPHIRPQLIFLFAISSIGAIRTFTEVYLLSDPVGGPNHSTEVLAVKYLEEAFEALRFGRASVYAIVMIFLLLGLVYIIYRSYQEKIEH